MKITDTMIRNFRTDFAQAMVELELKYGVKVNMGNVSYNEAEFTSKITVKQKVIENGYDTGKVMVNPNTERSARWAFTRAGIDEHNEHLPIIGSQFKTKNGDVIVITDFKTRNSRYPLIFTKGAFTKGSYKGPVSIIAHRL